MNSMEIVSDMKHPNGEKSYLPNTDVDTRALTLLAEDLEYLEY
jgi:predicted RNA-binding protein with EMAP domain